ncbi:MAG: hypothetical protein F4Z31_04530 [Gemmatimonadetes bacterium]|nr:hypothetical protein [Gemmatimonadota bacterium]MYF07764.1 hypothetical protein [Rhodospirillaceae bacterium]
MAGVKGGLRAVAGRVGKKAASKGADIAVSALVPGGLFAALARKKRVRRAVLLVLAVAVLAVVAMFGSTAVDSDAPLDVAAADELVVSAPVMAAYQQAALLRCDPGSGDHYIASVPDEPVPTGWKRIDWRLVAAIAHIESGDVRGRTIDAYGGVWPPVVGPMLDGTIEGLEVIADTDKGRYDGSADWDAAVGPVQFLPSNVAAFGIDATGDGVVDPQNVFDAAMSAAYYLCMTDSNIRAYNDSAEYEAAVVARYGDVADVMEQDAAWPFPAGLPAGWMPPFEVSDPQGNAGVLEDAPLRALVYAASAQAAASVDGVDVEALVSAQVVDCTTFARCAWRPGDWGLAVADDWAAESELGIVAPLRAGDWVFAGAGAASALPPRYRLPALAGGVVAWPVAVDPLGVSDRYEAPEWWTWHIDKGDSVWTADGPQVSVAAPIGAWVGWPASGSASFDAGCGRVVDAQGWAWTVCGLVEATPEVTVAAGDGAGRSSGAITIALEGPGGELKCPQALFAEWPARPLTPAAAQAEQEAREQEAYEQAERERQKREQAAIEAALDAGIDPATLPPVEIEVPVVPNPLEDCHG